MCSLFYNVCGLTLQHRSLCVCVCVLLTLSPGLPASPAAPAGPGRPWKNIKPQNQDQWTHQTLLSKNHMFSGVIKPLRKIGSMATNMEFSLISAFEHDVWIFFTMSKEFASDCTHCCIHNMIDATNFIWLYRRFLLLGVLYSYIEWQPEITTFAWRAVKRCTDELPGKICSKLLVCKESDDGSKPGSQELQQVPALPSHQHLPVVRKREDKC